MQLDTLKQQIPDYAKDLRLNLAAVLGPQGAPGLSETQIFGIAVASALAARHAGLASALEDIGGEHLGEAQRHAARSAAAIMGMNNIYYRFVHLVSDAAYGQLPARLRMNVIGSPGIDKLDFELLSLAVSAVNGCGMCVDAHEKTLRQGGLGAEAVQSAVRIAAVIHAVAVVLDAEDRGSRADLAEAA